MATNYEEDTAPPQEITEKDGRDQVVKENHEMEFEFETEDDLLKKMTNCSKNPGHQSFIPVQDFSECHLPEEYRSPEMMRVIRLQAELTVRLRVRGSSSQRPHYFPGTTEPYPFGSIADRKIQRTGSGWVEVVLKYPESEAKLCPCKECCESGEPREKWAEIGIRTAAHVVFDITEGQNTSCYFFFDSDKAPLSSFPSLRGAVDVKAALVTDTCYMMFLTHNLELTQRLFTSVSQYQLDRYVLRKQFSVIPKTNISTEAMKSRAGARLGQGFGLNTAERGMLTNFLTADRDGRGIFNLVEQLAKTINEHYEQDKRDDLKKEMHTLLMKNIQREGPEKDKKTYDEGERSEHHGGIQNLESATGGAEETVESGTSGSGNRKQTKEEEKNENDDHLLDCLAADSTKTQAIASGSTSQSDLPGDLSFSGNGQGKSGLPSETGSNQTAGTEAESFPEKVRFSSSHPLTVIVSHPHGRSKRITIGQITERQPHWGNNFSMFTYTNATCPGSSGARVFILGKSSIGDHAHSKFGNVHTSDNQVALNESVIGPDV